VIAERTEDIFLTMVDLLKKKEKRSGSDCFVLTEGIRQMAQGTGLRAQRIWLPSLEALCL
jgi:hypothetical protein